MYCIIFQADEKRMAEPSGFARLDEYTHGLHIFVHDLRG